MCYHPVAARCFFVFVWISCLVGCVSQKDQQNPVKNRTVEEFVNRLRDSGITMKQVSPLPHPFPACKKGCFLYLSSLDEWIEVYEFDTPDAAASLSQVIGILCLAIILRY